MCTFNYCECNHCSHKTPHTGNRLEKGWKFCQTAKDEVQWFETKKKVVPCANQGEESQGKLPKKNSCGGPGKKGEK